MPFENVENPGAAAPSDRKSCSPGNLSPVPRRGRVSRPGTRAQVCHPERSISGVEGSVLRSKSFLSARAERKQRHDRGGGRFRICVFVPHFPGIAGQIGYKISLSTGQLCPLPGAPPLIQTAKRGPPLLENPAKQETRRASRNALFLRP